MQLQPQAFLRVRLDPYNNTEVGQFHLAPNTLSGLDLQLLLA